MGKSLLKGRKIHNVFHMSCLKKAVGQFINTSEELPPLDEEGQLEIVPEEVLEFQERKLRSGVIRECLIRWRGLPVCNVPFQIGAPEEEA
jgi:hypothetical protein